MKKIGILQIGINRLKEGIELSRNTIHTANDLSLHKIRRKFQELFHSVVPSIECDIRKLSDTIPMVNI